MDSDKGRKKYFTHRLGEWHEWQNDRSLPWKNEKDPYRIWLSEVILQQTRALQGLPYYLRFLEAYPTVTDLAGANEEEAFRLWQGLGYYNRCKNMLATARLVRDEYGGHFPASYEQLLSLKGIGPYTAAAIASFAFGLPHAVVDGNVYRVLSRYFGIETPFDTTEGKKQFAALAQELLDTANSAGHNQAIMDLGATVCTPRNPLCNDCPLQAHCFAFRNNVINVLPVRSKKTEVKTRYFNFLLLQWEDTLWIHKRSGNDIWQNLHQPYLIETSEPITVTALEMLPEFSSLDLNYSKIEYNGHLIQRLTHRIIESRFFSIQLNNKPILQKSEGKWANMDELKNSAFPKTLVSFLRNNLYF